MPPIKSLYRGMFKLYRWPVLVLIILFSLGIILGVVLPGNIKLLFLEAIMQKFTAIIGNADTASELSQRIFLNNVMVSALVYGLGFTVLFPVIMMIVNGVVIGLFLELMYRMNTLVPGTFWSSLVSLVPHGIFELTAFFISGALSIMVVIKAIWHHQIEPQKLRRRVLAESAIRFVTIVVPLLMIAAIVESFVSPQVGVAFSRWLYQRQLDASLAITPATEFMEQHQCRAVALTDLNDSFSNTIDNNLTTVAGLLYDPVIYEQLRQRAQAAQWEQYYECNNNIAFGLKVYRASDWSVNQAEALQVLLAPANTNNTTVTIRSSADKTVMVLLPDAGITPEQVLRQ